MSLRILKSYSLLLVLIPLTLLLAIAAVNTVVDPYRIQHSSAENLYTNYPDLHPNLRLHKAFQVRKLAPTTIILGTSKAIQGVPLNHNHFANKPVYNLGAPLASMREIHHLLLHAQANQKLKEVIFFVDFLSFNALARNDGPAAGYIEQRLDTPQKKGKLWDDYLATSVSADALRASSRVLFPKEQSEHRVLNGRGGRESEEILSRLNDGGHRSNSQRIERFFVDSVLLAAPHRRFAFTSDSDSSLYWFEQMVRTVQELGINTSIVIGPSHTRYWQLLSQAQLWNQFEQWKSELVAINTRVAKEREKPILAIWDFTLANSITSEPFPEAGDAKTRMQYYFEAVHFNQHTGGLVLDKIIGNSALEAPDNFGVLLDENSLPKVQQRLREQLREFRQQEPTIVNELQQALP